MLGRRDDPRFGRHVHDIQLGTRDPGQIAGADHGQLLGFVGAGLGPLAEIATTRFAVFAGQRIEAHIHDRLVFAVYAARQLVADGAHTAQPIQDVRVGDVGEHASHTGHVELEIQHAEVVHILRDLIELLRREHGQVQEDVRGGFGVDAIDDAGELSQIGFASAHEHSHGGDATGQGGAGLVFGLVREIARVYAQVAVWVDDSGDDVLAGSIDCGGGIRQYGFIGDQNDLPVLAAHTGAHHAGAGDDQRSVDDLQIEHVSSILYRLCAVWFIGCPWRTDTRRWR